MVEFTGNAGDFSKIGLGAAAKGNVELVREILKAKPDWLNRAGPHGRTLLWEAAHRGRIELVKYLVGRRKANVNSCGTMYTPYFVEVSSYCIARFKKRHDVADYLLTKNADIDIHTAAFLGDLDLVKSLLKQDKKLIRAGHPQHMMAAKNDVGPEYYPAPAAWATPLCYALRGGDLATAQFLIQKKSKIKGFDETHFEAANDDCDLVRLLLENGADPKFAPEVDPDAGELYDIVLAFGGKPASKRHNSEELVYLCRGDRGGNPAEVKRLLKNGANVDYQDAKGKTALHRAAKSGFIESMAILLKQGASSELEDLKGETPLFDAIRSTIKNHQNQIEAIKLLIETGADTHHTNQKGATPLDIARISKSKQRRKIVNLLNNN